MIVPSNSNNPVECGRCKLVVAPFEDQFSCIYCHINYCQGCLGYTKFFDMDELEAIIMK